MNKFPKISILAFIVIFLLNISNASAEDSKPPLKIGVILPLTGGFGFFGEQAKQGITVALEEINSAQGRKVTLIFEDDKCLPKDANTAFRKLTQIDKVDFILGPGCSGAIFAINPLVENAKINVLALLDSGEKIREMGPNLFALGFDSEQSGRKMASYIYGKGIKKVGVLFETDEWAELVTRSFIKKFRELRGSISVEVSQNPGETDYRSNILKLAQSKPEALYVVPAYNGGLFLKQLRSMGQKLPVFGPDTFAVNEVFEIAGPAAEGTICSNAFVDEKSASAIKLSSEIEKISGKAPTSLLYASMGYDGLRIAYRALTSPESFSEAMTKMKYTDGIIPVNGFDADGIANLEIGIFRIQGNKFERVK